MSTMSSFLQIPQRYFVSFSYPKKKEKNTQSAEIVLTLWIHRTEEELKLHFFGPIARKGGRTVISRSFPRSVEIEPDYMSRAASVWAGPVVM